MIIIGCSFCCMLTWPNLWPEKRMKKNKVPSQRWRVFTGRRPVETWSPIFPGGACRQAGRLTMAPLGKVHPSAPPQQPAASRPPPLCIVQSRCWECKRGILRGPPWLSLWWAEARNDAAASGYDFIHVSELGLNSWCRGPLGTYKCSDSVSCLQTGVRGVPGLPGLVLFLAIWCFS